MEGSTSEVVSALSTAFTSIQTDATSVLKMALPIGLSIFGAVFVVKYGKRLFQSVTGR